MSSPRLQPKIDHFFDAHSLTLGRYFTIGALLSSMWAANGHVWGWSLWANLLFGGALVGWLIWIGPRYLQRKNRQLVLLLGALAFFLPMLMNAFLLWLSQPGWPLDGVMGGRYMDSGAFIWAITLVVIVCGLLLLRMKMYDVVSVKRHSKKDLFQ